MPRVTWQFVCAIDMHAQLPTRALTISSAESNNNTCSNLQVPMFNSHVDVELKSPRDDKGTVHTSVRLLKGQWPVSATTMRC